MFLTLSFQLKCAVVPQVMGARRAVHREGEREGGDVQKGNPKPQHASQQSIAINTYIVLQLEKSQRDGKGEQQKSRQCTGKQEKH